MGQRKNAIMPLETVNSAYNARESPRVRAKQ
jgi:hypothetical protein